MNAIELAPHWRSADTIRLLWLGGVLVAMTLASGALRLAGRTGKGRGLAADFGARTFGWWLIVGGYVPAVLAGGAVVLGVFAVTALVLWWEMAHVCGPAALRRRDLGWAVPAVMAH